MATRLDLVVATIFMETIIFKAVISYEGSSAMAFVDMAYFTVYPEWYYGYGVCCS
jgi:hypothetical protein